MFTGRINEISNGRNSEFDSIIVLVNQCNVIMHVYCLCVCMYVCEIYVYACPYVVLGMRR